jgi:hypothetical protein
VSVPVRSRLPEVDVLSLKHMVRFAIIWGRMLCRIRSKLTGRIASQDEYIARRAHRCAVPLSRHGVRGHRLSSDGKRLLI